MNIEKIKNFNQKVLAVFGVLGIVLLCIIIIWVAFEFITDAMRSRRTDNTDIVANEKAQENFEKNIRTHQISFENLLLADTANAVYVIPVSQTALKMEEYIDRNNTTEKNVRGLFDSRGKYSDFYYANNSFNNALIYDSRDSGIRKLFTKRVSINRIDLEKISGDSYVFFAVTDRDSNKDGVMSELDSKTLYVYATAERKLEEVKSENTDFVDYTLVRGKKELIIKYGLDKDKNGSHAWDEPVVMKLYSLQDNVLRDLIAPKVIDELQNTLDGKN